MKIKRIPSRIPALFLAVSMIVMLAACGGDTSPKSKDRKKDKEEEIKITEDSFVGSWGEEDSTHLVLDEDGTGIFFLWGEETDIRWKFKEDKVTFQADEKYTVTLKGKSGKKIRLKNETGNIDVVLDQQTDSEVSDQKKEDDEDNGGKSEKSDASDPSGESVGDWTQAAQKDDKNTPGTYVAYAQETSDYVTREGDPGAEILLDIRLEFKDGGAGNANVMGVEFEITYEDGKIWHEALRDSEEGIIYTYVENGDELLLEDTSGLSCYYMHKEGSTSETALILRGKAAEFPDENKDTDNLKDMTEKKEENDPEAAAVETFEELLDLFREAQEKELDEDSIRAMGLETALFSYGWPGEYINPGVGYLFYDINGDDMDELIITYGSDLVDIYGFNGKEAVHAYGCPYRGMATLYRDGMLLENWGTMKTATQKWFKYNGTVGSMLPIALETYDPSTEGSSHYYIYGGELDWKQVEDEFRETGSIPDQAFEWDYETDKEEYERIRTDAPEVYWGEPQSLTD